MTTTYRRIEAGDCTIEAAENGTRPELLWVPIDRLVIDETYQRPLSKTNWESIRKIAQNFDWSRFSACQVAPVTGGDYALIDGQHRTTAAYLCGITEVPALSVSLSPKEQASAFAWINGQKVTMTDVLIYKAALAAGEEWAVTADQIATEAGCRVMTYMLPISSRRPRDIYSINELRRKVEAGKASSLLKALKSLAISDEGKHTVLWTHTVFAAWLRVVCDVDALHKGNAPIVDAVIASDVPMEMLVRRAESLSSLPEHKDKSKVWMMSEVLRGFLDRSIKRVAA